MDAPLTDYYPARQGRLIGICGAAGSGKSTVAHILEADGWKVTKFAGPLKDMLTAFYRAVGLHFTEIQARLEGDLKEVPCQYLGGQTPRHAMQTLGTEWGRQQISQGLWISAWRERTRRLLNAGYDVVVDDLRFANEAEAIRSLGGTTIRIERPDPARQRSSHASEDFAFECDEMIRNDGPFCALSQHVWSIVD